MALLSMLRSGAPIIRSFISKSHIINAGKIQNMSSGPAKFAIRPSSWDWHKFKDLLHFYVWLGVIPLSAITLYVNVFIGPATLVPIPEGYIPKKHEYYAHPVSRFIARFNSDHQELYEKHCHTIFIEQEKVMLRKLEKRVQDLIRARADAEAYHYNPVLTKFLWESREKFDEIADLKSAE